MSDKPQENGNEKCKTKRSSTGVIDATFKHLAVINGEINKMNTDQLIEKLKLYGLDTRGNNEVLRIRLKNNYRKIKLDSVGITISDDLLPYYVIIDFEATCLEVNTPDFRQEIIEFPAVLVNSETQEIEDTFQMYCKPVINPLLSEFCIELTGITQEQVDSADSFVNVLSCFETWLKNHKLGSKYRFSVVTDASWDMCRFLYQQCIYSDIKYPHWAKKWVNLKRTFGNFYKCEHKPLKKMLNYLDMEFEGRLHCGLDDAKNIARILIRIIRDGANIQPNEEIKYNRNLKRRSKKNDKINKTDVTNNDGSLSNQLNEHGNDKEVRAYFRVINSNMRVLAYDAVKKQRKKFQTKLKNLMSENHESLVNNKTFDELLFNKTTLDKGKK